MAKQNHIRILDGIMVINYYGSNRMVLHRYSMSEWAIWNFEWRSNNVNYFIRVIIMRLLNNIHRHCWGALCVVRQRVNGLL